MGIIYQIREVRTPDLHNYERELNADGTEKHITCDGARYHVLSYHFVTKGYSDECEAEVHCSEPNCEINRGRKP